jgi:hypothetical protein
MGPYAAFPLPPGDVNSPAFFVVAVTAEQFNICCGQNPHVNRDYMIKLEFRRRVAMAGGGANRKFLPTEIFWH